MESQLAIVNNPPVRPVAYERHSLVRARIANFPFQLLPRSTYSADELERALAWQRDFFAAIERKPHFVIALWVENCSEQELAECLAGLAVQSFEQFELVVGLADETINLPRMHSILDEWEFTYTIVESVGRKLTVDNFINAAHSRCLDDTSYGVLVSATSVLHPSALYVLAKQIQKRTPDLLYANEVLVDRTRAHTVSYIRRAPSDRYSLLSMNGLGELLVLSSKGLFALLRELPALSVPTLFNLWSIGAITAALDLRRAFVPLGLLLRTAPEGGLIYRVEDNSTQLSAALSHYAERAQLSIQSFEPFVQRSVLYLRPKPRTATGTIQVIIPYRNQAELTVKCLERLAEQECADSFHVTLVDNDSVTSERIVVQKHLANTSFAKISHISVPGYFNYARLNNVAAASGDSEFILFLNNDVELSSSTSISELRNWCALSDIGVVGGALRYDGGKLQHGGINFSSVRPANISTENLFPFVVRETNGVTFAMALVKRTCFKAIGGLDEFSCPNGFGDALFGQVARAKGFKVLYTPYATGIHHESISRGRTSEEMELLEMVQGGIPIADLYPDFYAEFQPMLVEFTGLDISPFTRIVDWIQRSPRLLKIINPLCKMVLRFTGRSQ